MRLVRFAPLLLALAARAWAGPPSVAEVRELLERRFAEDGSAKVRHAAGRLLAPLGHEEARALLLASLEEEPGGLGLYDDTLAGLSGCDDPAILDALVAKISGAKTSIHRAKVARATFPVAPERALAAARAVLADPSRPREARLARELAGPAAQLGTPDALAAMAEAYRRYGADQSAGRALVQSLLSVDPDRARELVLEAATSSRWTARKAAARDLRRFDSDTAAPVLADLFAADSRLEVRTVAGESLLYKAPARLGELALQSFPDTSLGQSYRAGLADIFGTLGWLPAEDLLLDAFQNAGPLLRAASARGLGGMGSQAAAAPLLAVLAEHDAPDPHWMRTWCARGLAGIRTAETRAGLGEALRHDTIGYVLEAASRSLASHKHPEAYAELRASADPVWPLANRLAAVSGLGADGASVRFLGDIALNDPAWEVRAAAARALGAVAGAGRLGPLLSSVGDGHPAVRTAALGSLGRREEWAYQAGPAAEKRLEIASDAAERVVAAAVLAKGGGPRAIAALGRAATSDADRSVRTRCLTKLEGMDLEAAMSAWRRALAADPDKTVRLLAASALGRLDPAMAWPELRSAAQRDADENVRRRAVLSVATLVNSSAPASD